MKQGMTLIEVLAVVAIVSVVGIALNTTIVSFYRNNAYLLEETQALNNAHTGLNEMTRAIREASYGDDGSYPIANAATSTITLYSNADKDTAIEKITYTLVGTSLYRTSINSAGNPPVYTGQPISTTTLSQYVRNTASNPLFTYYDVSGNQLSATSTPLIKIAAVRVELLDDLNPLRAPNVFTLTETATIRNLRVSQ
jgi:prepilin-type N-terminal cleavage/methylation domain-containing protein